MKKIIYQFNTGTEENPVLVEKTITCPTDNLEANLAIAKAESHNGEYTIVDDGQPEPEPIDPTEDEEIWDALASALQEGVDSV